MIFNLDERETNSTLTSQESSLLKYIGRISYAGQFPKHLTGTSGPTAQQVERARTLPTFSVLGPIIFSRENLKLVSTVNIVNFLFLDKIILNYIWKLITNYDSIQVRSRLEGLQPASNIASNVMGTQGRIQCMSNHKGIALTASGRFNGLPDNLSS